MMHAIMEFCLGWVGILLVVKVNGLGSRVQSMHSSYHCWLVSSVLTRTTLL